MDIISRVLSIRLYRPSLAFVSCQDAWPSSIAPLKHLVSEHFVIAAIFRYEPASYFICYISDGDRPSEAHSELT